MREILFFFFFVIDIGVRYMYMDCTYLLEYLFEKYDTDGGLSNTFLIIDN